MKRVILTLAAALSLAACLDSPSTPGQREPTPPDPPTGTDPSVASQSTRCPQRCLVRLTIVPGTAVMALNEHAEVAGYGHEYPFRWSKRTGLVRSFSSAEWLALNSWHRQVAGVRGGKPVVWDSAGDRVLNLPDMTYGEARGINDWGRVVGTYHRRADDATLAYRWSPYSGTTVLPSLQARAAAGANDINHGDDAVGYSLAADGQKRAVLWPKAGGVRDLGVLSGHVGSEANAVSNKGHVAVSSWPAGLTTVGTTRPRAALWTAAGGLQPLGTLGGETSVPTDVNAWGEVVGSSTTPDGQVHAFVWHAGTMVRLDEGGAGRSRALAINSWGDIVGTLNDGELVAWVWEENLSRWQ